MISLHTPPGTKIIYAPCEQVYNVVRPYAGCPLTVGVTYILSEWRAHSHYDEPVLYVEGFAGQAFWRGLFRYASLPSCLTALLNVAPIMSDREYAEAPCDTEAAS